MNKLISTSNFKTAYVSLYSSKMVQSSLRYFTHFVLICGLMISTSSIFAQTSSQGKDFWLSFTQNNNATDVTLSLFITSDVNTSGTVTIPGLSFSQSFTVTAGNVTTVGIPSTAMLTSTNGIENKAIHVTSNDDVIVYGLNRKLNTTDAYLAIPTVSLGTEYIITSYNDLSGSVNTVGQIGIVATEDNTEVTITPTSNVPGKVRNVPYTITLQKNEAYQVAANPNQGASSDLTGSIVVGSKPISVFGSHRCANVPVSNTYCDYLVEQLPSKATWGKEFITASLATRTAGDIFRIVASADGTTVSINGSQVATLSRGQFHEVDLPSSSFNEISTSQPCLVVQYSKGGTVDGTSSDPFMMLVTPKIQYLGNTNFTTPASGFRTNYVNIITPDAGVGQIKLDGIIIPASSFSTIRTSGYSGVRVSVSLGAHRVTIDDPSIKFNVSVYGFDNADSYGYPAGQTFIRVNEEDGGGGCQNPNPFNVTVAGTGVYCSGGSGVEVGLSGSQQNVSYQLYKNNNTVGNPVSGTGNPLSFGNQTAGTYTVVARQGACSSNMSGSATVSEGTVATLISGTTATACPGTSVNLRARASGLGLSVRWERRNLGETNFSPAVVRATPSVASDGTASLSIEVNSSDNGAQFRAVFKSSCSNNEIPSNPATVTYRENQNLPTPTPSTSTISCGQSVTLSIPAGSTVVRWEQTTENPDFYKRVTFNAIPNSAGLNSITLSNQFQTVYVRAILSFTNCQFDNAATPKAVVNVSCSSASSRNRQLSEAAIFPNPVENEINVALNYAEQNGSIEMTIMDVSGRTLIQKQFEVSRGQNILNYPTSNLPSGMFYVRLNDQNGLSQTLKFVKQ